MSNYQNVMDEGKQMKKPPKKAPVPLTVHWESGPRTAAWNELWRRIFADIFEQESKDAKIKQLEPETDRPE